MDVFKRRGEHRGVGDVAAGERHSQWPAAPIGNFTTTSFVIESLNGELAAFLVGFLSQTEPDTAYIHFVGVDPAQQGRGVGRALYRAFLDVAADHGRQVVRSVTSPENAGSRAFHASLGFTASEVLADYDGPDLARVAFTVTTNAAPARGARRLRVLDGSLLLEQHDEADAPARGWVALVRAPEGLTVIRPAVASEPAGERWVALYDAEPDHGLDEPGLLAAVLTPLARAAVPVFVASTHRADLVLIPEERAESALSAPRSSGFVIA